MGTLYGKIKDDLLKQIKDGIYQEGDLIPTETQLARQYSASRPTVRQALQLLVDAGYLERRRRRGTVVCQPDVAQHFHHELRSYVDEMQDVGKVVTTKVIVFQRCLAPQEVIETFGLLEDEEVYKLVRLRYTDGVPSFFLETYIPCYLYPGLDTYDFNTESLYRAMGQCGKSVASARSKMSAVLANDTIAALLDKHEGDPLFRYLQVSRDTDGGKVEFTRSYYSGELTLDEEPVK